jgi:hypothetical protein
LIYIEYSSAVNNLTTIPFNAFRYNVFLN